MRRQGLLAATFLFSFASASELPPREVPPSFETGPVDRADIVVKGVRLTDNGDNDGFADPNETVNLYVTLRNSSGADRDGIVVIVASTDPNVDCISSPVVAFGSLLAGQERESTVAAVFHVANVSRSDAFASLSASFDFQISGSDFGGTVRAQRATVDLDLNVSGGFQPSTYTEGFEGAGFGSFTTMTLDTGKASLALSDGQRCQYNDPDDANSNSYGNTFCYLGFTNALNNAYDWHVHGTGSADGGRAYLGSQSLHWGVHAGPASVDTTRLKQLDAIRTIGTVNLGWNGVTPVLSFKHQIGLVDTDYGDFGWDQTIDRGVVQVQLANSSGAATGAWRKIEPYENVYDMQVTDNFTHCMFDPTDDGNTEDDYFDPTDPERRLGPSSTCTPEFVFSHQGAILWNSTFDPTDIRHASDGPGLQGAVGPGTWVQSKFDLARYRGRRVRLRFLLSTFEIYDAVTQEQALGWNRCCPVRSEADDGWYIDDIQVTNTLTSGASVTVDGADRSGLPACGPVCASITASLIASPPTVDADEAVTLDGSGSAPDQCPGGTLHYRFWMDADQNVLQEWGPDATATDVPNRTVGYGMDVRCSTHPVCAARATVVVPLVCQSMRPVPFPYSIAWTSQARVEWAEFGDVDTIRGDLDALRASGGQFDGTVQTCIEQPFPPENWFIDVTVPEAGRAFYYLVRRPWTAPACSFGSWGTGSPAEVAGRDTEIPLDPHTCP